MSNCFRLCYPDLGGGGLDPKQVGSGPELGPNNVFFVNKTLFYNYSKNHYSQINRVPE